MIRFLRILLDFLPVPIFVWKLRDLKNEINRLENSLKISYKESYEKETTIK